MLGAVALPEWFEAWTTGAWEHDQAAIDWIRSRPDSIKALMVRFPPSCVVMANRPLKCPAPGQVGCITSYTEPGPECPNGLVSVRDHGPRPTFRAQCQPEWLVVVGYYKGWTPQKVQEVLDGIPGA